MARETPRIALRPFRLTDVDDVLLWAGDDQVGRTSRWKTLTCREEALTLIKDVYIPHPCCRSICIDDRPIGYVSFSPGSGDDKCRADIGYALAAEYWGQGITPRAVKMVISEGLKKFPEVVRMQAFALVENRASHRVLEKVGFVKEGVLRKYCIVKGKTPDLVLYSLLTTEFVHSDIY